MRANHNNAASTGASHSQLAIIRKNIELWHKDRRRRERVTETRTFAKSFNSVSDAIGKRVSA